MPGLRVRVAYTGSTFNPATTTAANMQRIDTVLKSIEGITQEMVDKVIALGLIDVRDIEEVGTGPLMEELALDEAKAEVVVTKSAEEAKIVAAEQDRNA